MKVTRFGVDPARDQQHLLVLDVDALDRPDALGEVEDLRLAERLGGEPAAVLLPDRPAGSGTPRWSSRWRTTARSRSPSTTQVGAVADADLVDLA